MIDEPKPDEPKSYEKKKVAVACQGGGIHASFSVGVLTEILKEYEKERFELVGLSGTSAGRAVCPDGVVRPASRRGSSRDLSPEVLEPIRRQLGIADRMLDVLVTEPGL
jgi:hypothetical protein